MNYFIGSSKFTQFVYLTKHFESFDMYFYGFYSIHYEHFKIN